MDYFILFLYIRHINITKSHQIGKLMNKEKVLFISTMHFLVDSFMAYFSIYFVLAGLDPVKSAVIASITTFIGNILQPVTGYITDKIRGKIILFLGIFLASISASLLGVTKNYIILAILLGISKIGSALFHPSAANIASGAGGNNNAKSFAIFSTAGTVGYAFSQLIFSSFTKTFGLGKSYFLAIPGLIVSILYLLFSKMEVYGRSNSVTLKSFKDTISENFLPIFILYLIMVFRSSFVLALNFFIAKILHEWGYSRFYYSSANTVFMVSGASGLLVAGWLSKTIRPKHLLSFSLYGFIPFFLAFITYGPKGNLPLSFILLSLTGFILYSGHASNVTMGHRIAPDMTSTISGILMGFAWGTSSFGPALCALLKDTIPIFPGITSGLVILSALPLTSSILVYFLPDKVEK